MSLELGMPRHSCSFFLRQRLPVGKMILVTPLVVIPKEIDLISLFFFLEANSE
jgi:hypothetical protein